MHPSPIITFLHLFPSTRVQVYDDELVYSVSNFHAAAWFEAKAQRIILENKLPLTAQLEEWGSRGYVFGRFIVVKSVPEESMIAR
jgi:hypothetical protein